MRRSGGLQTRERREGVPRGTDRRQRLESVDVPRRGRYHERYWSSCPSDAAVRVRRFMFRLIGRSYARAKSASVGLDLPHASARFTFVVVGFLIVAFAIVSNTSVVPGILDGLGSGVFWFGVVA